MDMDFIISDDIVSSEVYDKRDDFNFKIIFSFWMEMRFMVFTSRS